jgi:hypothetical protein
MGFNDYYTQSLMESVNDKGLFKAVFITSVPFAGKSYTVDKIKGGQFPIKIVNTDIAVEFLAKKYDINPTDAYSIIGGNKIKVLTKKMLFQYLNGMLPLIIDGTSSSPSNLLKRKGILEGLGYETAMVHIDVTIDTALDRLHNSGRERLVDENFIKRVYKDMEGFVSFYKQQFNEFYTIPNNEGELTDDVILKSYNTMQKFFSSKNKNPLADINSKIVIQDGAKYLSPSVIDRNDLTKQINNWYAQ